MVWKLPQVPPMKNISNTVYMVYQEIR